MNIFAQLRKNNLATPGGRININIHPWVEYLIVELNDNLVFRWTLVGVTSFGVDCARPDFPGKYTPYSLQF